VLVLLLCINAYRAWQQSIVHDEAFTYHVYLAGPSATIFEYYTANLHFLFVILAKLSVTLFGVSAFAMRLPTLVAGALYFAVAYRLSLFLFEGSAGFLLSVLVLTLNPLVLDFLVAARGYGLALALLLQALCDLLAYLSAGNGTATVSSRNVVLYRAGGALALSVTANLAFLIPAIAMSLLFVGALLNEDRNARAGAGLLKPLARLHAGLGQYALPMAYIALVFFLVSPVRNATKADLYAGSSSLVESIRLLIDLSFAHKYARSLANNGTAVFGWWSRLRFFVLLPPLLLLATAMLAFVSRKVWRGGKPRTRAELALYIAMGTIVVSVLALVAGHYVLGLPYPTDRTGLYLLPLFTLASLASMKILKTKTGPVRWLAPGVAVVLAISVVIYAGELNTNYFAMWMYDADTRDIVRTIAAREANGTRAVRLGLSWVLEPSVNYYRTILKQDRIQPADRSGPDHDSDYFVLVSEDHSLLESRHLKTLQKFATSGVILAVP